MLEEYAKDELRRIGMIDSGEPYNDAVANSILDLIKLFAAQGHSGFTAPYTIQVFRRLASFKPLTPLTGEDDEWSEVEPGCFQNKRYSAVFKKEDGKAYNIEAKIFSEDGGETWFTSRDSREYIEFPYTVPDEPEEIILE